MLTNITYYEDKIKSLLHDRDCVNGFAIINDGKVMKIIPLISMADTLSLRNAIDEIVRLDRREIDILNNEIKIKNYENI